MLIGHKIALDPNAANAAVGKLTAELGLSTLAMAEGILRLATVSLAGAIKEVSVMRGIDPRDFALIAFGGAGPLHGAAIADELGMATVVIPPLPGNFSALGLLIADVRRDFVRTRVCATSGLDISDIRATLQQLVREGETELVDFPVERLPADRGHRAGDVGESAHRGDPAAGAGRSRRLRHALHSAGRPPVLPPGCRSRGSRSISSRPYPPVRHSAGCT